LSAADLEQVLITAGRGRIRHSAFAKTDFGGALRPSTSVPAKNKAPEEQGPKITVRARLGQRKEMSFSGRPSGRRAAYHFTGYKKF